MKRYDFNELNKTQMLYINVFFLLTAGIEISRKSEEKILNEEELKEKVEKEIKEIEFKKIRKIYYISVPKEFKEENFKEENNLGNIKNKDKKLLAGEELARLFNDTVKEYGIGSLDLKGKRIVKEIEVKYVIRNEVWDWDKYKEKKEFISKSGKFNVVREWIEELSKKYELGSNDF